MVSLGGSHPYGEYETKVLDLSLTGLGVVRSGVPEQAVNPARRGPLSQDGRLQIDRQWEEQWLHRHRRAWRSHPTVKVRNVAVRRYASSKVRSLACALLEQL